MWKSVLSPIPVLTLSALALGLGTLNAWSAEGRSAPSLTEDRPTRIGATTSLRSMLVNEDFQQAGSAGLRARVDVDHRLASSLAARLAVGLTLESGFSQSTFSNEYRPVQGLGLLDAHLVWNPLPTLESSEARLRGGVINQGWLESPLLVGNVAFPAVMAEWNGKWELTGLTLTGGLFVEQAIPTSDTAHSLPRGNDPLPTADFERLAIGAELGDTRVRAHLGRFAFKGLPSGVAFESRLRGNTVAGIGNEASQYVYDFEGVETGLSGRSLLADGWRAELQATYLTNLRAPLERSRAALIALSASHELNPALALAPIVQIFRSESDSSPAYYNISSLAHNNRRGFGIGLKAELSQASLELEGMWVQARVIRPSPFQSDFSGVVFSLRKSYELL